MIKKNKPYKYFIYFERRVVEHNKGIGIFLFKTNTTEEELKTKHIILDSKNSLIKLRDDEHNHNRLHDPIEYLSLYPDTKETVLIRI